MQRRNWPAFVAAFGAVFSLLLAVWPGAMIMGGAQRAIRNESWWFGAHALAGAFGIYAVLTVNRYTGMARAMLFAGVAVLLSLLFTEPYNSLKIITVILPAALLGVAAPFIGPAVTPTNRP